MRVQDFIRILGEQPEDHFFAVTPDLEGTLRIVRRSLLAMQPACDVRVHDGSALQVAEAREVASDARRAPLGGSRRASVLVWRAERMPRDAAAMLLAPVEEAGGARFIFLASGEVPDHVEPLASRSVTVRLPFLSRRVVLGNVQALRLDARAADEADLWDGTLGGTLEALRCQATHARVREALGKGAGGYAALAELVGEAGFDAALRPSLLSEERAFLEARPGEDRRRLAAFLVARRA